MFLINLSSQTDFDLVDGVPSTALVQAGSIKNKFVFLPGRLSQIIGKINHREYFLHMYIFIRL